MSPSIFDPFIFRRACKSALPEGQAAGPPEQRFFFVPSAHFRALERDAILVVGARGAGKSVWWNALLDSNHRTIIDDHAPGRLPPNLTVRAGFGDTIRPDYPSHSALQALLDQFEPKDIWRTILCWHVIGPEGGMPASDSSWQDRIAWTTADESRTEGLLLTADARLRQSGETLLVVFDAIDRSGNGDWQRLRRNLRDLLLVALEFRGYSSIRLKVFVRPDMLEDREVTSFPDASKLINDRVPLDWPRRQLYGLLWQYLGNAVDGGPEFRAESARLTGQQWSDHGGIWRAPKAMNEIEDVQHHRLMDAIAGPWMGRDQRRGLPYVWLPNHLGDVDGRTSPRSFIAAVRKAADETPDSSSQGLHFEAIKKGVQQASTFRVQELSEDFPWTEDIMKPLEGLVVPCDQRSLTEPLRAAGVINTLRNQNPSETQRLPPRHLNDGEEGLIEDLIDLRILHRMKDGRLNMPDVYRVAFGLGRRGGVKPVR